MFVFVEDDNEKVAKHLVERGVAEDDLHEHFYFLREWWRKRVRMIPHKSDEHARWIKVVHAFVKKNMAEFYDKDLATYFLKFEQRCGEGWFEELGDDCMFRHVGVDSHGLDLWIRLRGTNRAETFIRKCGFQLVHGEFEHALHTGFLLASRIGTTSMLVSFDAAHMISAICGSSLSIVFRILIQKIYNAVVFPRSAVSASGEMGRCWHRPIVVYYRQC